MFLIGLFYVEDKFSSFIIIGAKSFGAVGATSHQILYCVRREGAYRKSDRNLDYNAYVGVSQLCWIGKLSLFRETKKIWLVSFFFFSTPSLARTATKARWSSRSALSKYSRSCWWTSDCLKATAWNSNASSQFFGINWTIWSTMRTSLGPNDSPYVFFWSCDSCEISDGFFPVYRSSRIHIIFPIQRYCSFFSFTF